MKKFLNAFLMAALVVNMACNKDDDGTPEPEPTTETLEGSLSTRTLDASKVYTIKGQVFVNNGVTLTIPAGTVLKGDKATKGTLIINKGGKIMAEGTSSNPIVFTSGQGAGARDKGDWGGIVMLGNANVNTNGATIEGISPAVNFGTFQSTANDTENSGVLKYVRIEYAGIALSPNNETNSLTMGAIGSGTTIENVQVSFGGDDGFEWFGGTVNGKNLISFATWDDDFDTDFGWQGKVQHALVIRDPFAADQSGSNAFESDNESAGNGATPRTIGVFSNVTVLGPMNDSLRSISGNYQNAMHLKKNTGLSIYNSVFAGFPVGLKLESSNNTESNYTGASPIGELKDNIMVTFYKGTTAPNAYGGSANAQTYWEANNDANVSLSKDNGGLTAIGYNVNLFYAKSNPYPSNPDFSTVGTTGTSASGADFTHSKLTAGFFTTTTYRGAFGGTDWTDGWAEFYPLTKSY